MAAPGPWSHEAPTSIRRLLAAVGAALLVASCDGGPEADPLRRASERVFVMGFDGMDPRLAQRFMDEGKLPHLKRLAEQGSFATLGSTQPSESPTAWSSFATGVNPGKHAIYDFLVRDVDTYLPDLAMVKREPAEFLWGLIPTKLPMAESTREGTSFWVHAGRDGVRSVLLTIPVTWPPEDVPHGEMLGGLPLPDVRATMGTFSYWATDLSSFEEGSSELGGYLKRLLFDGGTSRTVLKGPENPVLKQEQAELRAKRRGGGLSDADEARLDELAAGTDVDVAFDVAWEEGAKRVTLEIQGQRVELDEGQWSDWVPLEFEVSFLYSVHGMARFHVVEADRELRLYASPVNYDPRESNPVALSTPGGFAKRLAEQVGVYRTLGWAESADKALNDSRLTEAEFLYDSERAMDDREKLYHGPYLRSAPDLQVGFHEGYRVGWQDTLGQIRHSVVEDNLRKWSGDHCATATEISGGVLFTSRPLAKPDPHITDLAPTVLELLGVPIPGEIDGEPVL